MTNGDMIAQISRRLGISDTGDRMPVDHDEAMLVLKELAKDIQHAQRAVGMVLWHLDPNPVELIRIAEDLKLDISTLKSWLTTYSRLRHSAELATVQFSMQQQLARIQNSQDRMEVWQARHPSDWTLAALTEAVSAKLEASGGVVMPKTKKAGCVARFGDDRRVKANLDLLENAVEVTLTVAGAELEDMRFEEVSTGVYRIKFSW